MIRSLSRALAALRLELGTPTHEEGITTFSRVLVNPKDEVLLKGTDDGVRDGNGRDPFKKKRSVVLIDNENSITLTSAQSGALVVPSIVAPGHVILPASPEDGDYFTIATKAVGSIIIEPNTNTVTGNDGEVSDTPETDLTTGAVTLVWSEAVGTWLVASLNGTYTTSSGV